MEEKNDVILSAELSAELGGNEDENGANALILPSKKKKKNQKKKKVQLSQEMTQQMTQLSKKKKRKLEQLAREKEKKQKRATLYSSLEKEKLSNPQHVSLLIPSSKVGQKKTKRERLHRTFTKEKLGLALTPQEQAELVVQSDLPSAQPTQIKPKTTTAAITTATFNPIEQVTDSAEKAVVGKSHQDDVVVLTTPEVEQVGANPVTEESSIEVALSENDAMEKLRKLREKNEAKRTKRIAEKQQTEAHMQCTDEEPREKYTPHPIEEIKSSRTTSNSTLTPMESLTDVVSVNRKDDVQLARMQLPVCGAEQEVMEAISMNPILVLCGETGSGKTTQVPQFLYEAGYGCKSGKNPGIIGVTQPRRVAAVSTAKRVAHELNVQFGKNGHVGYQIRHDTDHVGENTRVKFMTDGILLREVQSDFLLQRYSVIILDEAHERNVNTDILIGLLSRIIPLREKLSIEQNNEWKDMSDDMKQTAAPPIMPLRLIIMSATLRIEDFTQNSLLFSSPPPVIKVDARQHPVTIHFNKHTELNDYVQAAFKKICKIHRKLPEGGILVFLTGRREILQLIRKLKNTFLGTHAKERKKKFSVCQRKSERRNLIREHDDDEEEADEDDIETYGDSENEMNSDVESDSDGDKDMESEVASSLIHVLPLYSLLDSEEQLKVFDAPPEGHRLIVVATNVAETSLTIPGITYVVDAGRTKERVYDLRSGISEFQVKWVSKASADQRAGRAGRTGPGHCYRLFSSAVYDTEFEKFSPPEILCQPIEDLVLQMKAMGIDNIEQFPFPTPPNKAALKIALSVLLNLGALHKDSFKITDLGKLLSMFPIAARFAKMMIIAKQNNCLEFVIAIVAALSGQSPFISVIDRKENEKQDERESKIEGNAEESGENDILKEWKELEELRRHAMWIHGESDALGMLRAAGAYAYAGASSLFCNENHLHEKTMNEMLKLRQQLTRIVNRMFKDDKSFQGFEFSSKLNPPSYHTEVLLRQILTAGFLDNVVMKAPKGLIQEGNRIERNCAYVSCNQNVKEPLYIHPHSHLFSANAAKLPKFLVYQQIQRTSRAYMKNVTLVDPKWLPHLAQDTPLLTFDSPLESPTPIYNLEKDYLECYTKSHYGYHGWELPVIMRKFPDSESDKKFRWFARCILEGAVIRKLGQFQADLVETTSVVTRKNFDKKIQLLIYALKEKEIDTKTKLVKKWCESPSFLQAEFLMWIKSNRKKSVSKAWKSIVQEEIKSIAQLKN